MKQIKLYKNWAVLGLLLLGTLPIVVTLGDVIFNDKRSVVFLGNYGSGIHFLVISYYILLIGLGLFWLIRKIIFITKLNNEKSKVELMLLKSQVSPHFFFNMLNNLYALVEVDTNRARELILKLSDTMRYSIYEGEKETVTLEEEVEFLRNYIALHEMRYHKMLNVKFIHNIEKNVTVAPLLFIILVENAFKHGVEHLRENAKVNIELSTSDGAIMFTVENNFDSAQASTKQGGIGLKNLTRRLELTYPNNHKLLSKVSDNVYHAQLTIN
ncbi:MAG: hypothetical protein Wins2KO_22760 [Winogradskyella sp.]